jgi:adenylate cyclase
LNTGPLVAGVIGIKKISFDLWGGKKKYFPYFGAKKKKKDTVNVASRMESTGIPNRIQVSQSTYEALKDLYHFEERKNVSVKGRGEMTTFVFLSKKEEIKPKEGTNNNNTVNAGEKKE